MQYAAHFLSATRLSLVLCPAAATALTRWCSRRICFRSPERLVLGGWRDALRALVGRAFRRWLGSPAVDGGQPDSLRPVLGARSRRAARLASTACAWRRGLAVRAARRRRGGVGPVDIQLERRGGGGRAVHAGPGRPPALVPCCGGRPRAVSGGGRAPHRLTGRLGGHGRHGHGGHGS